MLDRSIAPSFVAPKKFDLPEPEIVQFSNGSRFFFLNVGDQPVVKLEFIFKAGTWFEAAPGISFFSGKMLTEGTRSFTSREIAEQLDHFGAFIDVAIGFDYINLSIHIPTRHVEKIKSILSELLLYPTFPENELILMKDIQLQQLKVNEQKNKFMASRLFRSYLYGDFPYGHIITEEVINKIRVDNVKDHFEKYIKGKFDIFLTGKFDSNFQRDIIHFFDDQLVKSHDFGRKGKASNEVFQHYLERKESLQSSLYMGRRCINRNHRDYGKLLLLNEVFGGYFGSRLMQNIREDKGLTYSIYSQVVSLKQDAYFAISSDVKKDKKEIAIEEINREIDRIKSELIDQEELIQVKNYLKGSILNTLTAPFAITEKLKNIYYYDLNKDFYNNLFDQIDQTSSEVLITLANDILFDQPLSSVIVG